MDERCTLNDASVMTRFDSLAAISARAAPDSPWDLVVVGGGATGLGVALDAASRGFSVVLLSLIHI